jgi:hypothetical protein
MANRNKYPMAYVMYSGDYKITVSALTRAHAIELVKARGIKCWACMHATGSTSQFPVGTIIRERHVLPDLDSMLL